MTNDFFSKVKDTNSLVSESKILEYLGQMHKAVVISLDNLDYFQKYFLDIKLSIENASASDIHHISVSEKGIDKCEVIEKRCINEAMFHNIIDNLFRDYSGYCFIVDSGISYMLLDGKIDPTIDISLSKTKTMQEKLKTQKNVENLREVFENFYSACKYQKVFYDLCFDSKHMIRAEIKEQELRNILLDYLNKNVKGDIQTEFCTDYHNDEESVDIYLNDGVERAIIEVKFSFSSTYYCGKTIYPFPKRIGDGLLQLDKYARHLSQGSRQVEYAFLYMFYCNDSTEDEITTMIQTKLDELEKQLSDDFYSVYKDTITNNMKYWYTKH